MMTPMPDDPPLDAFLDALRRSRLLDADDLGRLAGRSRAASARELADFLVREGELTHYQSHKLLAGRVKGLVVGPYRILAPLGRGGMGTLVYLARDRRMSESLGDSVLVALKVLPDRKAQAEPRVFARFRREMELGRRADHPNVVRTIGSGEAEGVHYLALEFVPGKTVRHLVTRDEPLPAGEAARIFADVAAGLAHLHARGLVHRDVKPANVMVRPDGRAVLLDLGLAYAPGESLPEDPAIVGGRGYVVGTMDYLAPEQARDAVAVGPAADLYGLGCALYLALTGSVPYPAEGVKEKVRRHRRDPVPLVAAAPPEFARFVQRLMAKHPEDRPPTAESARAELLRWATPPCGVRTDSAPDLPGPGSPAWELVPDEEVPLANLEPLPDENPFARLDGGDVEGSSEAAPAGTSGLAWALGAIALIAALAALLVAMVRQL
jgi:serine/threonine protein kinase